MIKNMEWDSSNTTMAPDIMDNGKKIKEKVMVHTPMVMVINTREIGIEICKMVQEHIILPTEISIKDSGSTEDLMAKATISM